MRIIGGWAVSIEAGIDAQAATYDDPGGGYDQPHMVYDADGQPDWWPLDCQLTGFHCDLGATPDQSPGVAAEAGKLLADLYDPDRLLDATGTRGRLLGAGVLVRVVAAKGAQTVVAWSGTADGWPHDMLSGEGSLDASDTVAALAPVPVVGLERPAERTPARLAAILGVHPHPPLFLPDGVGRELCPATLDGDMWQVLRSVVDTDQSWLWVDAGGAVRWQGRGSTPPGTVLVDCPGDDPWDAVYTGLTTDADDTQMANIIQARRVQPDPQPDPLVLSDGGSIAAHGPETLTNTALQLATDSEVAQWAEDALALRAYPVHRPLKVVLAVDPRLPWADRTMDTIMALQIASPLRILLTTRGAPQEWAAVVGSISHEVDPRTWTTTIGLGMVAEAGLGGYDGFLYDTAAAYDQMEPSRELVAA